jgi:hypothetical protein
MVATSISTLKGRDYAYERIKNDYYREPRWAVEKLLQNEQFQGSVLDPCCGGGTIVSCCLDHGLTATGSDIASHGFGGVADFFSLDAVVDNVIGNPPFSLGEDFVRYALTLVRFKVAFLLRINFLEAEERSLLFSETPLARVWVLRKRASCPPGIDKATGLVIDIGRDHNGALLVPPASGGTMTLAWFVWQVGWDRWPQIRWL